MRDLLAAVQPSYAEFAFVLIMVLIIPNVAYAIYDMTVHDGLVGKIIAYCYPGNSDRTICAEIREEQGCEITDQICLGNAYQFAYASIVLLVGISYFTVRLFVGIAARRGINLMTIIIAASWGWSALALFYFGWSDWLYYTLRNLPIPESLPWLDNVGLVFLVEWIHPELTVSAIELYTLMAIGLGLFIAPWAFLMHHWHKGTLEEMGLIQELDI